MDSFIPWTFPVGPISLGQSWLCALENFM
jgi:hypothetical protein